MGLDRTAEALLICRSDAPGESAGREVAVMEAAAAANGATEVFCTDDPAEGEAFAAARRAAFPALERLGSLLLEDVGVALPVLPALVRGIEQIAADAQTTIAVVAHAGDGNTHPLIVYNAADPIATERAVRAFGQVMDLALALGGTITGEHGVGRSKKPWLPEYLGDDVMALSRRIKDALESGRDPEPGRRLLTTAAQLGLTQGFRGRNSSAIVWIQVWMQAVLHRADVLRTAMRGAVLTVFRLPDLIRAARAGDREVLDAFDAVCAEAGGFAVTDVPLEPGLLERVHRRHPRHVPAAQHRQVSPQVTRRRPVRGLEGAGRTTATPTASRDHKEMFHIGPARRPDAARSRPHRHAARPGASGAGAAPAELWPTELPQFAASWHAYYRAMAGPRERTRRGDGRGAAHPAAGLA